MCSFFVDCWDFKESIFIQVAPSPSSGAAVKGNLGTDQVPVGQPTAGFGSGTCIGVSNKCQDDHIGMTACFFPAGKGDSPFLVLLDRVVPCGCVILSLVW